MAFNLGDDKGPISDINVTPLVDVMLVLLVIFMVSAPLMFSGIKLDLPKTKKVDNLKLTKKQVILSVTETGELVIDNQKFLPEEVIGQVMARFQEHQTQVLYLRADYKLDYGVVAKLISNLKKGGVAQIALVTEIEK
ncbi:MAG: protein TolR [Halobacteriovoraceae bacterium]|nr:protein TolR [Halobacteriovoraceae bacterium]|tara:strand:- start:26518 stop:26928 length:411 start_codon:yes stop_codon:yes gene_type:complete